MCCGAGGGPHSARRTGGPGCERAMGRPCLSRNSEQGQTPSGVGGTHGTGRAGVYRGSVGSGHAQDRGVGSSK